MENVKDLRRSRFFDSFEISLSSSVKITYWNDDRLVFKSQLLTITEAYTILKKQQYLKKDFKHLLLEHSIPKCYEICHICNSENDEKECVKRIFN